MPFNSEFASFVPPEAREITPLLEKEVLKKIFERYFEKHVKDFEPNKVRGNKVTAAELSGLIGCKDVIINRCVPKLEIPKIQLEGGKQIVLIGPNGGGKTTVFDAIMESNAADFDSQGERGAVKYGIPFHNREKLRISRLNQEEMFADLEDENENEISLDDIAVGKIIDFAKDHFAQEFEVDWSDGNKYDQNIQNQEAQQRIEELKSRLNDLFGINQFLDRKVKELSGGERTKLSLCMVLMSEPDCLLLDEPTNHLDVQSLAKLSGLLETYMRNGVSVLTVSHVDSYLREAGKDGVLEIMCDDNSRKINYSNSKYSQYIKDRSRGEQNIVDKISWNIEKKPKGGALISPTQEKISLEDSPLQDFKLDPLLPGDLWVLNGENGTGKTHLMEAMVLRKRGRDTFERTKGTNLAYLPQFWPEEIQQGNLQQFFDWIKETTDKHSDIIASKFSDVVKKAGFKHVSLGRNFLNHPLSSFSGGEQRLLWFLAISSFKSIDGLVLDEPTNHMDQNIQKVITKAIQDFPGAVVLSTHDLKLLETLSKDGGVGNKGSTLKPKNLVLNKKQGKTSINLLKEDPYTYMTSQLSKAKKAGSRIKT